LSFPAFMANASNPSHILIGRHTRGNHPSTSPIETHAAATGVFRLASAPVGLGSPPLGEVELMDDFEVPELDIEEDTGGVIEVDPTFVRDARLPGSVKIVVESTTFWRVSCTHACGPSAYMTIRCRCHKEVLYFASPFFEAILSGAWAETTGRPESISSVLTISQPPSVADPEKRRSDPTAKTAVISSDSDHSDELDIDDAESHVDVSPTTSGEGSNLKAHAIADSLNKLEGSSSSKQTSPIFPTVPASRGSKSSPRRTGKKSKQRPDAVILLKEERVLRLKH
jgi:hypothetical protein